MAEELRLEGRLEESNLARLMYSICRTGETGTLYLQHGEVKAALHIREGKVVFASSTDPDFRLGELLLRHGRIGYEDYERAAAALRPGKRFGTILVEMGVLSPKDLYHYVVEQVKEIIFNLFTWTEGRYRFEMGPAASKELITLNINTADLVLEGIKRIESWQRIKEAVGSLETLYEVAPDLEKRLEGVTLTEGERRLLDLVREKKRLGDILRQSPFPDFEACRLLWAFSILGLVTPRDALEAEVGELLGEALGEEPAARAEAPAEAAAPEPPEEAAAEAPAPGPPPPASSAEAPKEAASAALDLDMEEEQIVQASGESLSAGAPVVDLDLEEEAAAEAPQVSQTEGAASSGAEPELEEVELVDEPLAAKTEAAAAEEEAPGAWDEAAWERFCEKQRYLLGLLKAELGDGAAAFVEEAVAALEAPQRLVFDGLKPDAQGLFEAEALRRNVLGNRVAQPAAALEALIEAEVENAKKLLKNPARIMVLKKGLSRFDEEKS